jgi:malate dehydrogenase
LALLIAMRGVGDIVLYDVVEGMPQGKALDIMHALPIFGKDCRLQGTNNLADIAGCDVCIVTAGSARKPGMSRDDLVQTNAGVVRQVGEGIKKYAPNCFVILVTNPLDTLTYLMRKVTGFPAAKVVGMAGVLDTARYQAHLAEYLNISVTAVSAFVLGGHGDDMVPVRSYTVAGGIPISKVVPTDKLDALEKRVRTSGGEIVALLKSGSAFYSPAAATIQMLEAYLFDKKKPLVAAAEVNGQYGLTDMYIGVPVIIGAGGVEKVMEIELTADELKALQQSAERVRIVNKLV